MPPVVYLTPGVERRMPASLLLIAAELPLANMVFGTLERALGVRVFVWHERALEPALRVLAACRFRLILLDVGPHPQVQGSVLRAIKTAAPDTPLALLRPAPTTPLRVERRAMGADEPRLTGASASIVHNDPEALVATVRRLLGVPSP